MLAFFEIIYRVVSPIFLIIGLGYGLQKKIGFDSRTLIRLNFWVFTPGFLFAQITTSKMSGAQMGVVALHFALVFIMMGSLAWLGATLLGARDRLKRALTASVVFYNSGNYGVPVAKLAFGGAGTDVQAITITLQNVCNFSLGLFLIAGGRGGRARDTLRDVLRLPMIYTLFAAFAWRATGWALPFPVASAFDTLKDGLVPVALITLGAQMALLRVPRLSGVLTLSLLLRLCVGPLLGFAFVLLLQRLGLNLRGDFARALIVSTSFPTAVNSALVAVEYNNEPEFASAAVFYSTLLSALSVSLCIYLVKASPWLR